MSIWIVKAALVQSLALLICALLRHHSAVVRRRILICSLIGVCALPLVSFFGPGLAVSELVPEVLDRAAAAIAPTGGTAGAAPVRSEVDGATFAPTVLWAQILAAVWLLGVVLLTARWVVGLVRINRLCRRSSPVTEDCWRAMLAELTARPVKLLFCPRICSPMTVGPMRPVILLPGEARAWPASQAAMALAHEVAHIRRWDALWNNVSLLARALQWMNPLAWWLHRQLRLEMERSADEAVVGVGAAPHRYAELLLALAARPQPTTGLAMARTSTLEQRFRSLVAIASQRRSRMSRWIGLVVLGFSFGLGSLHAGAADEDGEVASQLSAADWQQAVDAAARRLRAAHPRAAVRIGVMRVAGGALTAAAGAIDEPFGSGSTIKPLTVAAALEEGVPASTVLDCSRDRIVFGGKEHRDYEVHGKLSVAQVLARSSNVGTVQLLKRIRSDRLFDWLRRLGIETAGRVTRGDAAGVATGISLDLSVKELLSAYATIANDGVSPSSGERVLRAQTARAVLGMLREAVEGPGGTGQRARVNGVSVGGKTGTTDRQGGGAPHRTATFVGLVPADHPRWAVVVAIDGARPGSYGGAAAAPAFASIIRGAAQL